MRLMVYSVFDSKAGAYLQPFFAVNRGVAIRSFSAAVADEGHVFHANAEDFSLFELGEFCQESGALIPYGAPEHVTSAHVVAATRPIRPVLTEVA